MIYKSDLKPADVILAELREIEPSVESVQIVAGVVQFTVPAELPPCVAVRLNKYLRSDSRCLVEVVI